MMRIYFTGIVLTWMACIFMACSTSDSNEKAIWAYEQTMHGEAPFRFYPDTFVSVGIITVNDSLYLMRQALNNRPVESLMKENDATLNNLLGLQAIDLRYDLELSREEVSRDIDQLQNVGKWLNNFRVRRDIYLKMPSKMALVREVECRFSYDDSISGGKIKQDKIYYIHVATNRVVASREITPYDMHQTH